MRLLLADTKFKVKVYEGSELIATYWLDFPPPNLNQDEFSKYVEDKIKEQNEYKL